MSSLYTLAVIVLADELGMMLELAIRISFEFSLRRILNGSRIFIFAKRCELLRSAIVFNGFVERGVGTWCVIPFFVCAFIGLL